jgi:hypothetical protein
MRGRADQVTVVVALAALLLATPLGAAPADSAARVRLAAECESLLRLASKTPYGWAWRSEGAPRQPGRDRVVTFDVRTAAATGLVLHLAGERLGDERFTGAAAQVAKAVAAVQMNSGQFPATGIIRANAGGRDGPAAVPQREATCAALALLLAVTEHDAADGAGPARRAAVKGAHWLAAQQTRGGGWLVGYPPGAAPNDATKLIRLDTPEYRDAALALWLAARVLDEQRLLDKAEQTVNDLIALRIPDERSAGHHLWTTAYHADGEVLGKVAELSPCIDALASRHAMEALLAAGLLADDEATTRVLKEAAGDLAKLPKADGHWRRRYDLHIRLPEAASPGDGESETISGVGDVVRVVNRLAEEGPGRLKQSLDAHLPVERRIGLVLCGLVDDALIVDLAREPSNGDNHLAARLRRVAVLAWQIRPEPSDGEPLNGGNRTSG